MRTQNAHVDFCQSETSLYIVMGFALHGDFEQLLDTENCLDEVETKDFSFQILSALEYLHQQGIVHRDIKPSNIVLFSDLPRKYNLTDFGLFRNIHADNADLSFVGTHLYAAPEVYPSSENVKSQYDYGVDIWSFGAVLWFTLTGCQMIELTSEDLSSPTRMLDLKQGWDPNLRLLEDIEVSEQGQAFILDVLELQPGPANDPPQRNVWQKGGSRTSGECLTQSKGASSQAWKYLVKQDP